MKKIKIVILFWIFLSITGSIMKMYEIKFANLFLGISIISLFIVIVLFIKNLKKNDNN
jgi:hypothetical protein